MKSCYCCFFGCRRRWKLVSASFQPSLHSPHPSIDISDPSISPIIAYLTLAAPALRLRNVTQTSVTLEWDRLSLATASLLSLDIYRNGERLAPIPNPLHNTSTKLSGLGVDAEYTFHLVLKSTSGTYSSPIIKTRTHTMSDTSGISVCFGNIEDSQMDKASQEVLDKLGAKKSEKIQIDTTHYVCSDSRNRGDTQSSRDTHGALYNKAMQLSIPVVQPHWIFACHEQKK